MEKKLKLFLQLGFASTLVFCASALIGLTLALDTWRSAAIVENKISTHYTQGIFKECIRNSTHKKVCHDWRMSKYSKEFYQFEELILSLVVSSSACGGLSLLLSLAATTSRLPKLVLQVTVLELVSALLGIACLIIYTSQFIKEPWSPGLSYFCLWIGTIFMLIGLVTHTCVGDVKFYGRKFFIPPQPRYRYHKGSNTVVEL